MDRYDFARQITDEIWGEGTYAEMHKNNPDPGVQKAIQGTPAICTHCGAVWDKNHEEGRCGVSEATDRILAGWTPRHPPFRLEVRGYAWHHMFDSWCVMWAKTYG
jgi:hypothetical protein